MSALLCQANTSQLLIIDIQEKLAGAMPAEVLANVLHSNQILISACKALAIPVLHSEQYPKGLGHTHAELQSALADQTPAFEKTCFSSCAASGMDTLLNNTTRNQIVLTGMEAHICVLQTAMQLLAQGKQVFVVEDGVCSREETHFRNALARMRQAGAIITNRESVIFEWLGDASHPQFRELSKLIR
jgi:nicotinamidase-related amidase